MQLRTNLVVITYVKHVSKSFGLQITSPSVKLDVDSPTILLKRARVLPEWPQARLRAWFQKLILTALFKPYPNNSPTWSQPCFQSSYNRSKEWWNRSLNPFHLCVKFLLPNNQFNLPLLQWISLWLRNYSKTRKLASPTSLKLHLPTSWTLTPAIQRIFHLTALLCTPVPDNPLLRSFFRAACASVWVSFFFPFFPFLFLFMALSNILIHWNVRSLRANGHWLRSVTDLQAPILCLQETFLSPQVIFTLPGKSIYRVDRPVIRGGGLLTAISSTLSSFQLTLPPCPDPDFEILAVQVHLFRRWVILLNCYTPTGEFPATWFTDLLSSFEHPVILVGDLNVNILHRLPPVPPRVQSFLDWVSSSTLCLLNLQWPTREGPVGPPSLLDVTLLSPVLYDRFRFYVHPDPFDSDHHPVLLVSASTTHSMLPRRYPQWSKASEYLNNFPHLPCGSYTAFEAICSGAIAATARTRKPSQRPFAPWWDSTCRALLARKRKHFRLARSLCSRDDWLQYKRFAAKLRRYIRQASRRYWDNFVRECGNSSSIFRLLRRMSSKDLTLGDNAILNPAPLASITAQSDAFLTYFSKEEFSRPLPYDLSGGDPSLNAPFTFSELQHALHLSRPTTPGADGIHITLLRNLSQAHQLSLLDILNGSFLAGSLPPSWKLSTIVPIRKPGKPAHLVSSYRPIALTSVCCKLLERMILRRLLAWCGQRQLFSPDQFGFIPTRDCTLALCTLLHDVLQARSRKQFVAAVCLDIQAAYDSVNPDTLIYKLASCGIRGHLGLWLASFVTDRAIQVRWKSYTSPIGPCFRGVPQGSVLSPFLYNIYMSDIGETLADGVRMILYADDIILYVIGDDEISSRRHLQDTLARIQIWCKAHDLCLSPTKCSAINFSRCRDSGAPFQLLGVDIDWRSPLKILGVWFTRTLCFTPHFTYIKAKAQRRLNYLKAITGRSRGLHSSHMLCIVNAIIRSLLEYGAPLFFDAPPSGLNLLEVSYNDALRLSSGLPRWTPLPILHRETGSSSVTSRLRYLSGLFLLRLLSSPPGLRLQEFAKAALSSPCPSWKWWPLLHELLDLVGSPSPLPLPAPWPPPSCCLNFRVVTEGLAFQDPSLPQSAIIQAWSLWFSSLPPGSLLATDASKDPQKTAIAVFHPSTRSSRAVLIHHCHSVFTAEALALYLALTDFSLVSPHLIILSDSQSVLRALDNWSFRSPRVILFLLSAIQNHCARGGSITFVWCPGHSGIPPNEHADSLAKHGPFLCSSFPWIVFDDLRSHWRKAWLTEIEYYWINSDYAISFPFLLPARQFPQWVPSRSMDVLMARWRSRTIITHQRLYRMALVYSPLCTFCYEIETPDHILLHCPRLREARSVLLQALHLPPNCSYGDIILAAFSSSHSLSHLVRFSRCAFPHIL